MKRKWCTNLRATLRYSQPSLFSILYSAVASNTQLPAIHVNTLLLFNYWQFQRWRFDRHMPLKVACAGAIVANGEDDIGYIIGSWRRGLGTPSNSSL